MIIAARLEGIDGFLVSIKSDKLPVLRDIDSRWKLIL
jgi:hypothetical protein